MQTIQYTFEHDRHDRGWHTLTEGLELDLESQEIATIAVLTALGNAQPQLKVHIHRALDVGCTRTKVVETILQMAVCVGFPVVLNGITTAQEVFQERDA